MYRGARKEIPTLDLLNGYAEVGFTKPRKGCKRHSYYPRLGRIFLGATSRGSGEHIKETSLQEPQPQQPGIAQEPQGLQPKMKVGQATSAPRGKVLKACLQTSLFITLAGATLRAITFQLFEHIFWLDSATLASLTANPIYLWHVGVTAALVAAVTGCRIALVAGWPEFQAATNTSNAMVLPNLTLQDVILISFLPGFSEELLFSGGLMPACGANWPAVAASSIVFGVLHRGGGRNWAFAVWATLVSGAYAASYLYTQDLLVPATAHSFANLSSALIWIRGKRH